jgi:hypothetical protein
MQCPRLSYYLFTLLFLTKQNGNGRKSFLLLPFCLYVFIARALCVTECRADAFVLQQSLPKYLEQWPAALTIRLILRDPRSRELNQLQSLYQLYSLSVLNKLQYFWRGNYCKCVRPAQLRVLSSSSVLLGTISTIRSPPGPRRIQQISRYFWQILTRYICY